MAKKKKAAKGSDDSLSIEASMEELQQIVEELESGKEPLDTSLQQFERGMTLLRNCHQQLEAAAAKIELLTGFDADGNAVTTAFDGSATHSSSVANSESDDDTSTLF